MSNNDDPVTTERLMDELAVLDAETHDPKIRDEKAGGITSYETF
jgi:hypothetical protein